MLVILTMRHSLEVVKALVESGFKVSVITMSRSDSHSTGISGLAGIGEIEKTRASRIFTEDNKRLGYISDELNDYISEFKPSAAFCLSWHWILSASFLERFPVGVLGWHGSMFKLPHGCGRSPMNWSLRLGADRIFHTCFKYVDEADQGPIVFENELVIEPFDHIGDLLEKSAKQIYADLMLILTSEVSNNLPQLKNRSVKTPLRFEKLTDQSGEIIFDSKSLEEISDIVRSCSSPFPKAYVLINDRPPIRIERVQRESSEGCLIIENDTGSLFCLLDKSSSQLAYSLLPRVINGFKLSLAGAMRSQ